jgi:glycosyltransferase domain-containing protein
MTSQDLTILLTLKDRVKFTYRWMTYVNKSRFPFPILIADGGADETIPRVLADKQSFPNLDYQYVRYPYDETPTHYYSKIVDALGRMRTPFVVFADNDDFFLADGLSRSVEFLKSHTEYSSARGVIAGVRVAPTGDGSELDGVYGNNVSFVRQVYPSISNLGETAGERVYDYFSNYRANWYDVCRTEQALANFQLLRDLNIKDLILSQHVTMLLGVINGKVHVDSFLYLVRQMDVPESCDKMLNEEKGDHFDRMLVESWSEDFTGFLNAMAKAVSQKDGISLDEARTQVKRAYRKFIAPSVVGSLWEQVQPADSLHPARKLYRFLRERLGRQPIKNQYIAHHQLAASDYEFKLIYDFLSAQPSLAASQLAN